MKTKIAKPEKKPLAPRPDFREAQYSQSALNMLERATGQRLTVAKTAEPVVKEAAPSNPD